MGNSLGIRKKTTKVMKITGETIKFKTPVRAGEVVKDYPGLVLLESEEVKHYGIRAKPLEPQQDLKPKRLYFLVELPKFSEEKATRRVRSGIHMSAKDRLESLMLGRRSASDLSIIKATSIMSKNSNGETDQNGMLRLKMRLSKVEMERLMKESKDEAEVAEKIMELCRANEAIGAADGGATGKVQKSALAKPPQEHWNGGHGKVRSVARQKRVGFRPVTEGVIQLAVT